MRARIAALVLVAGCATARHVLTAFDLTAANCDLGQTIQFGDYGKWDTKQFGLYCCVTEANPVLGHQPSLTAMDAYAALTSASIVGLDVAASRGGAWIRRAATVALAVVAILEVRSVIGNMPVSSMCGIGRAPYQSTTARP